MKQIDFNKIDISQYDHITTTKSIWYNDIVKALNMAKQYIIKNKLVLTGGLAIHYALILKGKLGIYSDECLPDYDCVSDQHQVHAYNLAMILCKNELPNTNAIQGLHITTMRTRVYLGVENMDITYVPQEIFDVLSKNALTYKDNLQIIHPHFQMLDQHRALSLPFENEPLYSLDYRWKKDMTRFDLLYGAYPLSKRTKIKWKTISFSRKWIKSNCITGILALAYWINKAKENNMNIDAVDMKFHVDSKSISCKFPAGYDQLVILSDEYKKTLSLGDNIQYYQSLLQKMPQRGECIDGKDNIVVYDNLGQKISCHYDGDLIIANLQYVMLWILEKYNFYNLFNLSRTQQKQFATLYGYAINLVKVASELSSKSSSDNKEMKIFLPSAITYGKENETENAKFMKKRLLYKLGIGPSVTHLVPKSDYPDKKKNNCIITAHFDYTKSSLFHLSGEKITLS